MTDSHNMRSVHGGEDSHLCVEVSAVCERADGVDTCNDAPVRATAFGVYIRNPLALHVQDFGPAADADGLLCTMREAHGQAFRYAGALAEHLGCEVVSSLVEPATAWPSRFVVEGQRDHLAAAFPDPMPVTDFRGCKDARATQWALFRLDVNPDGMPIPGTGDLIEDYPTREAAEAAGRALDEGRPLPDPEWPAKRQPGDGERDEEDNTAAQHIVDALVLMDSTTDAQALDRDNGFYTDASGQRWRFHVVPA